MTAKKVICYTCRFCKMYSYGGIYCTLREKGGECIDYDHWESQEDVLDKIKAEIKALTSNRDFLSCNINDIHKKIDTVFDKYKAESEE